MCTGKLAENIIILSNELCLCNVRYATAVNETTPRVSLNSCSNQTLGKKYDLDTSRPPNDSFPTEQ